MFEQYKSPMLKITILMIFLCGICGVSISVACGGMVKKSEYGVYSVIMADVPAVGYAGGIDGLPATKPQKGKKYNPNSEAAKKYVAYLKSRHAQVLRDSGIDLGKKIQSLTVSVNSFSAKLTPREASKVAKQPGVVSVQLERMTIIAPP